MRIVSFPASIAILLLAALFFFANFIQLSGSALSSQSELYNFTNSKESNSNPEISEEEEQNSFSNRMASVHHRLNGDQAESPLLPEGAKVSSSSPLVDCCPSLFEMSEPDGGKNAYDEYVVLYRDGDKRQQFYEYTCKSTTPEPACRFMERKNHKLHCVQLYSHSYAIVLQPDSANHDATKQTKQFSPTFPNQTQRYMLDYIKIRSGCSFQVEPRKPKRSSKNKNKIKRERRGSSDVYRLLRPVEGPRNA